MWVYTRFEICSCESQNSSFPASSQEGCIGKCGRPAYPKIANDELPSGSLAVQTTSIDVSAATSARVEGVSILCRYSVWLLN